ncbi:centromere protein Cenp-K [Absidia repens]|uniref:Centromere protein Cenp-K n=1 Tax=Absidia repens TaxID=90262 RepID=A0A1X2IIY0_9FUNG|nr:centromere protein Cenp-K [Absidia repens]
MNIQEHLRSLMQQAAKDFDTSASKDPSVVSEEDGTLRSLDLDEALANQKVKRELLWNELHQIEENQRALRANHVFGGAAASDRKRLLMLLYEEQELSREREKQEKDIPTVPVADDKTIPDLQFKERLQRSVEEMTQLISFLKEQLTDAKAAHQRELEITDESQQVQEAITGKITELERDGIRSTVIRNRDKLVKARQQYQFIMDNLMDFLDDYYPPHLVDRADLTDDGPQNLCQMKFILEDLMNRAVLDPSNPYIELQDGAYWSPYIETLVKGNIAERHPGNSRRLKLVDFRIY